MLVVVRIVRAVKLFFRDALEMRLRLVGNKVGRGAGGSSTASLVGRKRVLEGTAGLEGGLSVLLILCLSFLSRVNERENARKDDASFRCWNLFRLVLFPVERLRWNELRTARLLRLFSRSSVESLCFLDPDSCAVESQNSRGFRFLFCRFWLAI